MQESFALRISTGVPTPIYRQIVDQISVAIASGALAPGSRLPSVRAVAEELVVNPNTVARAYGDLTRSGALSAQPGKGLYVAERRQQLSDDERRLRVDRAAAQFAAEVALLGFERDLLIERIGAALATIESGRGPNRSFDRADTSLREGLIPNV